MTGMARDAMTCVIDDGDGAMTCTTDVCQTCVRRVSDVYHTWVLVAVVGVDNLLGSGGGCR